MRRSLICSAAARLELAFCPAGLDLQHPSSRLGAGAVSRGGAHRIRGAGARDDHQTTARLCRRVWFCKVSLPGGVGSHVFALPDGSGKANSLCNCPLHQTGTQLTSARCRSGLGNGFQQRPASVLTAFGETTAGRRHGLSWTESHDAAGVSCLAQAAGSDAVTSCRPRPSLCNVLLTAARPLLCRDSNDAPLAGNTAAGFDAWSGASQTTGGIQPRSGSTEQLASSFRELAVASICKRLHASLAAGMEPTRSETSRLAQAEAELLERKMAMQREVGG